MRATGLHIPVLAGLLSLAFLACVPDAAASETGFLSRTLSDADGEHLYVVYVPSTYSADRRWPVILYLHGAGTPGTEGDRHLSDGLAPVIRHIGEFPAIVVFPQSEETDSPLLTRWLANSPDARRALRILDHVEREFATDPQRRILAGWSMGAFGVWSLAAAHPERWAAAVAVSGGGSPDVAGRIRIPVWAIHGERDRAIPPEQSRQMVEAVRGAGGQAFLTVLPDVGHDAWRYAFSAEVVREWMLAGGRIPPDSDQLRREAAEIDRSGTAEALDGEFRAALVVPRAVAVRLGNDALRTLAYGIPEGLDPELLHGTMDDLVFEFTAGGETFEITQSDVRFKATLERVLIEAERSGLVRVRVGLQPLCITIGATRIRGTTRRADTGAISLRLGHGYPLWIDLRVRPVVAEDRLQLELAQADFTIPDANWVVTAPEAVTVAGPDITPELVRTALVGGMYTRRAEVEQRVRDFLPNLVRRMEQQLQPSRVDRIVGQIWPLPVFKPRLRLVPEDVSVDADGLTLVMGLAAAAIDETHRTEAPVVCRPMGPPAADVPRSRTLEIAIAADVLQALSGMVVEAHAARIDVRDMPEPEFARLGDLAELTRVLPALARFGEAVEVRTELDLAAPFVVRRLEATGAVQYASTEAELHPSATEAPSATAPGDILAAQFEIPRLVVTVQVRERGTKAEWTPYARFDVRLTHTAALLLTPVEQQRRVARFVWTGDPVVKVTGGYLSRADAEAAVDRERLGELIADCWRAWTSEGPQIEKPVPDVVVGTAHLRLQTIDWHDSELVARFVTPTTRITNTGSRLIQYEVRGPFSRWSPRYQLGPGESHEYDVSAALTVRRLPLGIAAPVQVPVGGELDLSQLGPR